MPLLKHTTNLTDLSVKCECRKSEQAAFETKLSQKEGQHRTDTMAAPIRNRTSECSTTKGTKRCAQAIRGGLCTAEQLSE
jgi:hypothetical protein